MPNITAQTNSEKIVQIQSYLYQLSEQLRYAFTEVEKQEKEIVKKAEKQSKAFNENDSTKAQNTFNSIKALIIKSADIIDAYYEEINKKLSGEYVAQSEFGIYSEKTNQSITENSTEIERAFTNIQEITSSLEEVTDVLYEVSAYIKSGLIDYDEFGIPIYGIEIGQQKEVDGENIFNKFARFTADRLSFYDQNDTEVAYISDYRLYITEAQISGNILIGGYIIDSSDGLLFRWAGD